MNDLFVSDAHDLIRKVQHEGVVIKMSALLDECIGLAREARAYIKQQRETPGVDLYGPRGTQIRLPGEAVGVTPPGTRLTEP